MKKNNLLFLLVILLFVVSCSLSSGSSGKNLPIGGKVAQFQLSENLISLTDEQLASIADELKIKVEDIKSFIIEKSSGKTDVYVSLSDLVLSLGYELSIELPGEFSINKNGDKIRFSRGNLYHAGTDLNSGWNCEERQFDFRTFDELPAVIDGKNTVTPKNNCGTFYWTMTLGKGVAQTYDGTEWLNAKESDVFFINDKTRSSVLGDEWFVPDFDCYNWIINNRDDAEDKIGFAKLEIGSNVIQGVVILPDEWTLPTGCLFTSTKKAKASIVQDIKGYSSNTYTLEQWNKMEENGAVFLPSVGYRADKTESVSIASGKHKVDGSESDETYMDNISHCGYYWTTTVSPSFDAGYCGALCAGTNTPDLKGCSYQASVDYFTCRNKGLCLRLIKKV